MAKAHATLTFISFCIIKGWIGVNMFLPQVEHKIMWFHLRPQTLFSLIRWLRLHVNTSLAEASNQSFAFRRFTVSFHEPKTDGHVLPLDPSGIRFHFIDRGMLLRAGSSNMRSYSCTWIVQGPTSMSCTLPPLHLQTCVVTSFHASAPCHCHVSQYPSISWLR